jgi:8-amino-7-oxononanoate synthase
VPSGDAAGGATLDFTSALYLGLRHPSGALPGWPALTTGVPAAVEEPPAAAEVAAALAALVGCESAVMGVSTLHLALDVLGSPSIARDAALLWDAGVYPVARWAIERARGMGVTSAPFRHLAPGALERAVARAVRARLRPIVVTDGYCPGCARAAPIAEYRDVACRAGGLVVVDDTQALGIVGPPGPGWAGGGGSLRRDALDGAGVIWIASFAKAFGAPLAAIAAEAGRVARFTAESETRVHTSPPSAAAIASAGRALRVNAAWGEALRRRLRSHIRHFRRALEPIGLSALGGDHPVQLLEPIDGVDALALHAALRRCGVCAVPLRASCSGGPGIAFVVTAVHREETIERAVELLAGAVKRLRQGARSGQRSVRPRCRRGAGSREDQLTAES